MQIRKFKSVSVYNQDQFSMYVQIHVFFTHSSRKKHFLKSVKKNYKFKANGGRPRFSPKEARSFSCLDRKVGGRK